MRPKGMEDLAAFSAREVKRAAAEERDEYSSAEGQWESMYFMSPRGAMAIEVFQNEEIFGGGKNGGRKGVGSVSHRKGANGGHAH